MKKNIFSFLIFTFCFYTLNAQSITLDKNKVMDFFQNQQFEEAVNYLQPIVNNDLHNIQALAYLGYSYYMNDDISNSENQFYNLLAADSNNVTALIYLVNINRKEYPLIAAPFAMKLINIAPANSSYWRQMGEISLRLKQHDSARICFSKAYSLAPNENKNVLAFANFLIEKKEFAKADSILNIALLKDSVNAALLESRITSAYLQKDYATTILFAEKLMKRPGIYPGPLTRLALAYYNLNKYEDCVRVCEYLKNFGTGSESIFYYEASAYSKLKNYKASNALLDTCISMAISGTAESYYYLRGENDEGMRNYKQAIAQYDTAFYLFKNPLMKYNCGRIAETNFKNEPLAAKYYKSYIAIAKPANADERKACEYVKDKLKGMNKKEKTSNRP